MTGNPLNPALKNIYKLGVESRDKDIRRVIRHHQLEKAFDSNNSITSTNVQYPRTVVFVFRSLGLMAPHIRPKIFF